ncbi:MAG TPA: hypothetical protein EYP98_11660 [Planctomycetes bacterium]|nr:hypothetical protein [Planctomycetota bacterium]
MGSDRWINAMTAGAALLTIVANKSNPSAELGWLPFPEAVPWRQLVQTIEREYFERDPAAAIQSTIAEVSPTQLANLQNLSRHHAADLDWTAHGSRALENLLRESLSVPCRPLSRLFSF